MDPQMKAKIRAWVTPITVVVFLSLAGTGFLMEGHQKGLSGLHETLGYVFCAIAAAHIALNWRILVAQMKTAKAIMAIVLLGILSSLIWAGAARGEQGKRSGDGHHGRLSTRNPAPDATVERKTSGAPLGRAQFKVQGRTRPARNSPIVLAIFV